jgi:hypothetical protein
MLQKPYTLRVGDVQVGKASPKLSFVFHFRAERENGTPEKYRSAEGK